MFGGILNNRDEEVDVGGRGVSVVNLVLVKMHSAPREP